MSIELAALDVDIFFLHTLISLQINNIILDRLDRSSIFVDEIFSKFIFMNDCDSNKTRSQ